MSSVQKIASKVPYRDMQIVLESSVLPKFKAKEDTFHKYLSGCEIIPTQIKNTAEAKVGEILNFFG